ncbi:MAG TPA: DUF5719 family protein [Actinomycetota bacterium]|nr:DUF5719 family protein [Actinomycetota bacterium]
MTRPWIARMRLPGAVLVSLAVVAGGLALERGLGARTRAPGDVPAEVSGAWFCPHGGSERWQVWLVVANPASEPAQVRVVTYGSERPVSQVATIEPGTQRYVEVQAIEPASGSAVEYFGGPVAAGMVMSRSSGKGAPLGRAAEPCLAESSTRWYLPEGTTIRGFDQRVVVTNPFAQEAVISLWLTDERETLKPGELQGIVLPARRSIAFDLGDFSLGKETLATTVDVGLGKVAVGGVGISEDGIRAAVAVSAPATTWVLPGARDDAPSALTVLGTGRVEAPFRVRLQGMEGQVEVISEAGALPGRATTQGVPAQGAGLVAQADGPEPFVAGRRLVAPGDLASVSGVSGGATYWVALPTTSPLGGSATLIVENPGDSVADVRIAFLTEAGPAEVPEIGRITLRPGGFRAVDLGPFVGTEPVSVVVRAEAGSVVVGQASRDEEGYAVALGVVLQGA